MGNPIGGAGHANKKHRSLTDCFLIYNFLKKNFDYNQILVLDENINPNHVKFEFDDNKLEIKVQTIKEIYSKIQHKLNNIIKDIVIKKVDLNTPVLLRNHKLPKTNKFFREKFEEKFDVMI